MRRKAWESARGNGLAPEGWGRRLIQSATRLYGDDMDRLIAHELLVALGFDAARQTPQLVRLVLDEARKAKHTLTTQESVVAEVGSHAPITLTRARFDALIQPLLERTGVACRRALKDAGLKPEQLDGIILVGGSTRVPAVRRYVA